MPLGSHLQGTWEQLSPGLGRPEGMLLPPLLPLGCLLLGACGAAVSLGDCAEPPPVCPLLHGKPPTLDLEGQEMNPWQPTPSWGLVLDQGGQEEEEDKEDGHGETGGGVSTEVPEPPSPFS